MFEKVDIFQLYEKSSGANINVQKSEIMCTGTGRICDEDKILLNKPGNKHYKNSCYHIFWHK